MPFPTIDPQTVLRSGPSPDEREKSWFEVRFAGWAGQLTPAVAMGDALHRRLDAAGIRFGVPDGG